jgi:hypothetical protein
MWWLGIDKREEIIARGKGPVYFESESGFVGNEKSTNFFHSFFILGSFENITRSMASLPNLVIGDGVG